MTKLHIFFITLCLLWISSPSHAEVVFNAESTTVSLNGEMQFLADDDNRLSLADAIRANKEARMKTLPGQLSRGYAPVASWLSVVVSNDGAKSATPTLLMVPPYLDEVNVYVKAGAEPGQPEDYNLISVGDHALVAEQPLPTSLMTVPLSIAPGTSLRIFIHIHSYSSHNLSAQLVSPKQLVAKTTWHQIWQSAYIAIAIAMAIINFLLALRLKDKVYAMYGLYVLSIAVATIGIEGFARQLLPQYAHLLADWFVGAGVGVTFITVNLFIMFLFKTAHHHPWVYRYQQVTIILAAAMSLTCGTPWYLPLAQIVQLNGIILAFVSPWLAWRMIKRGDISTGQMFLLAFGANSFGVIITILGVLGILPLQEYTRHAVQFTSTLHMLLAMLGLSERVLSAEADLRHASALAEEKALILAREMNDELIASKCDLELSLDSERRMREEQSHFIDTISHEYRTPLSIVRTNLDILQSKKEIEEKRFGVMLSALTRLENIFNEALQAQRLGRPPSPKFRDLDLKALFDEVLEEIRTDMPKYPFDCQVQSGNFSVLGDDELLKTVFRNVLGNACKYRLNENISVSLHREDELAVLVVKNDMDATLPNDTEKLFERWGRGQSKAGTSGMGLGLYIVRRILHDHGGEASISSDTNNRFVITVTLPLISIDAIG